MDPRPGAGDSRPAEQQVRQLLALNQAAVAITGELELDSLLQRIVDVARELIGCDYAALGVLGDDGYIVRFPTSGLSHTEREQIGAPPRGHGLLGVMLRAGRSLRIPDMRQDPRRAGFPPNHPPMTSLLGVPIFVRGQLMGDLYLTDKIGGPEFSEQDEWLVQLLATHAATALTNAHLHQQVTHERARSQALLRVTQAINRSVQLDEVLHLIVQSALELLGAAGAAVFLLDPPGPAPTSRPGAVPQVTARYAVGLEDWFAGEMAGLPLDRSVAGRALRSGATQVVGDTAAEPNLVFPSLAEGQVLRSVVVVPLWSGAAVLGILSAYAGRPHAFDAAAVELLEAFGAQASTAIANARLYEETRRGREAAELEQQRLRELEQMKDEFLSTAAHELRTPLTTIRMAAGLADEQMRAVVAAAPAGLARIDPRLLELMGLVVEGSERMQSLVNDLLDLTRLEQGRTVLAMDDLDMRDVVLASVEATRPLFESKQQRLVLHVPETHCLVCGDRQRLEQVVINLLSNAHKYTPTGAQVAIRITRSGEECLVMVRDNGPGVPPDERERIFERFYRSSLHRQDRTASTGLGLPIARTIADLHRGRVWVDAAPEQGAIFTLALPILR